MVQLPPVRNLFRCLARETNLTLQPTNDHERAAYEAHTPARDGPTSATSRMELSMRTTVSSTNKRNRVARLHLQHMERSVASSQGSSGGQAVQAGSTGASISTRVPTPAPSSGPPTTAPTPPPAPAPTPALSPASSPAPSPVPSNLPPTIGTTLPPTAPMLPPPTPASPTLPLTAETVQEAVEDAMTRLVLPELSAKLEALDAKLEQSVTALGERLDRLEQLGLQRTSTETEGRPQEPSQPERDLCPLRPAEKKKVLFNSVLGG